VARWLWLVRAERVEIACGPAHAGPHPALSSEAVAAPLPMPFDGALQLRAPFFTASKKVWPQPGRGRLWPWTEDPTGLVEMFGILAELNAGNQGAEFTGGECTPTGVGDV